MEIDDQNCNIDDDNSNADLSDTPTLSSVDANQTHNHNNFFTILHEDIWLYLMTNFLGPKELTMCARVCKEFGRLANSEQVREKVIVCMVCCKLSGTCHSFVWFRFVSV